MVKQAAGSFRTAPRDALLQVMRMLHMGIFLEKVTQTSALRLYRLSRGSQLLRRLGPEWYVPGRGDFPLVVTGSAVVPGRRTRRPTALEALAARVPSTGPRVDITAVAPWEVPNWAAQLRYMGTGSLHTRKDWTRDLIRHAQGLSIGISFVHGCISAAGREDGTLVGAAAATFSVAGQALTGLDWTLGSEVLPFDAEVFGIAKAVEALAMYYTEEVVPPDQFYIFSSSSPALQAARNPRNRTAQKHALMFHQSLTTLSLCHGNVRFYLVWTPVDEDLEGQQVARHRATEACKRDPPQGLDRVQSAAFQKDRARRRAFQQWNDKWLSDNLIQPSCSRGGNPITSPLLPYPPSSLPRQTPSPLDRSYGHGARRQRKETKDAEVHTAHHFHGTTGRHGPRFHRHLRPAVPSIRPALKPPAAPVGKPPAPRSTSFSIARASSSLASLSPSSARRGTPSTPSSNTPASSPLEEGPRRCANSYNTRAPSQNPKPIPCHMCPPNLTESPEPGVCMSPLYSPLVCDLTKILCLTRTLELASASYPELPLRSLLLFKPTRSCFRVSLLVSGPPSTSVRPSCALRAQHCQTATLSAFTTTRPHRPRYPVPDCCVCVRPLYSVCVCVHCILLYLYCFTLCPVACLSCI
ncbi:hypothetical protein EDB92DRAFT_1262340 [Lactarius akahatsu]|uniref:Uncharacterized protein n=1 Tax=Lactarius akahatsu TaxID=416441 RepID=A0AAD4LC31_9AGAM|nr:hypothetical protein EDB92DRAFT_1262340 [Lactarius akahatsu]